MTVTSQVEAAAGLDDSAATAQQAPVAPRIERCGASPGGQLLLKCDEPAVIAVDVTGQPAPDVRWHVAGRRVRKSERYRAAAAGRRHSLTVLRVTSELEKGVWVLASNSAGEDSCLIAVKTYKVLSGLPNTFHDSVQSARQSVAMLNRSSTQRPTGRPFSPAARDPDVKSPTLTDWNREMEIRNRMRSVDDLVHYGRWKRESLGARRHNDAKTGGDGGADVSLNQSFSCASTAATDDEGRPGSSQRRRRTLRLRRRSTRGLYSSESSIVSAPVTRHINLDESVGSAALDVDSMFRFFALSTPVADDGVGGPAAKTKGPSSSGLPPSGAAGRTASAPRPTSLRRRRRPKSSLTNGCVDPSSFDDVQMTSSSVDLNDVATAEVAAAAAEPESSGGVEKSKPVGRSPRRRRTSGEPPSSPSSTDGQNSADAALTAMSTSATDVVVKPEALWELCGEKLNELCRRILDVGVTDDVVTEVTSPQNMTESAHADVKDVKPTNVVDASPPRIDTSPQSERRRQTNNVCLTLSVIPDKSSDQPTPQSSDPTNKKEDNWNDVENELTDVGSIVMGRQNDEDDDFRRDHTSPTVTADDVHSHTSSVQTAASLVPPLDGEHHVEQFQTETTLPEHCLQPEEAALPDQLRTVRAPLTISDNDAVHVGDVSGYGDGSAVVQERRGLPGLDINAMLSPSIDLQDILDTIYTLTGGVGRENDANDEDGTQPLSLHDLSPAGNAAHGDENDGHSYLLDDNDIVQLSEHAAAVCLERAGDDDESLLDFDAEMYGYDLSPVAADFADSVRLAIAEDVVDDLDIVDDEYDLDDDDVL